MNNNEIDRAFAEIVASSLGDMTHAAAQIDVQQPLPTLPTLTTPIEQAQEPADLEVEEDGTVKGRWVATPAFARKFGGFWGAVVTLAIVAISVWLTTEYAAFTAHTQTIGHSLTGGPAPTDLEMQQGVIVFITPAVLITIVYVLSVARRIRGDIFVPDRRRKRK